MSDAGNEPDITPVRQFEVEEEDDGIRLDRWFKRHLPDLSYGLVSRWARTGQLRLDGGRAKPGDRISAGQTIRVPPDETPEEEGRDEGDGLSEEEAAFARSLVLHRDKSALVLNKPAGLATQGGTGTHRHIDGLLGALRFGEKHRPRLVHRLDKDTSGALLIARSPSAAAHFSKHFSGRTARKIYWALVVGVPDIADGLIDLPLAKQPGTGGEKMHVDEEHGQPARSRYRLIERAGNTAAWLELQPLTGRTHQLRAHLAAIGHPIVGDGKYGGKDAFLTGSVSRKMHLHARRIRIGAPGGRTIDVTAPPPDHFAATLEQLGFSEAKGDLPIEEDAPPPSRAAQKQRARQHAKQVRKERRGERRKRGSQPKRPPKGAPKGPRKKKR